MCLAGDKPGPTCCTVKAMLCHASVRLHLGASHTLHPGTLQRVQASNLKALCPLLPELVGSPNSRRLSTGQAAALSAADAMLGCCSHQMCLLQDTECRVDAVRATAPQPDHS